MKATAACLAALLLAAGLATPAAAQVVYYTPVFCTPVPPAPDACGPGFYQANCCGIVFGPNYCLYPPFAPVNGLPPGVNMQYMQNPQLWGKVPMNGPFPQMPPMQNGGGPPGASFASHPFARGPRDFFMWNEANEDAVSRLRFPALIP
jgi:hypothetical protein